jgi:surface polysaccharide O-acyltransferase-like enzyme
MSTATAPGPAGETNLGNTPRAARLPGRRTMFDVTRLLAAYAIVWLHTPRSTELMGSNVLGRFAVPFFVVATVFFVWQGLVDKPGRSFRGYAMSRFERIYLPFLAWSGIYLAFKGVKNAALPEQPNDFPGLEFLWTGSFYHLWFMPFILTVSLGVFLLGRLIVARPVLEVAMGFACLILGEVVALWPLPETFAGPNLALIYAALPAVFWGIALSVVVHRGPARLLETTEAGVLGLIMMAASLAWLWQFGRGNMVENVAGLACTVVALAPWNNRVLAFVGRFGPLAYGIYLAHLLFIKSAEAILTKLGASSSWPIDVMVFLVAAIGSTALAWLLSQSRYTRWLAA